MSIGRGLRWAAIVTATIFVAFLAGFVLDAIASALAQANPFGGPRPAAPAPPAADGLAAWVLAKQAAFYRGLSGAIRAAKADGGAVYSLFGLSFLYGVFHAAGPGHGKAVISSYLLANEETWRRGVLLSFASAMVQSTVAVAMVGVAAGLLGATAKAMDRSVQLIEVVSYALIAAIGARLFWTKGRALRAALSPAWLPASAVAVGPGDVHRHGGRHHGDARGHAPGDACSSSCAHAHAPAPAELAGPGGLRRGLAAVIAVGLRPCSGAILVLVFALAQGLFWAGVASAFIMGLGTAMTVAAIGALAVSAKGLAVKLAASSSGAGLLALRGLELLGALLVLAFGLALLAGYMASERLLLS